MGIGFDANACVDIYLETVNLHHFSVKSLTRRVLYVNQFMRENGFSTKNRKIFKVWSKYCLLNGVVIKWLRFKLKYFINSVIFIYHKLYCHSIDSLLSI